MKLSEKVKQLRKNANMSQPDLAEISGLGVFWIQKLEQGHITNPGSDKWNCCLVMAFNRKKSIKPKK